jgi:hypothetical protein
MEDYDEPPTAEYWEYTQSGGELSFPEWFATIYTVNIE